MIKPRGKPERLDVAAELEAMRDNQFETACADAGRAIGLLASRDFDQARELFDQASRRANIAESGFMSAKHSTPEELVATMDWMVKTAQAALAGEELPDMDEPADAGFGVKLGQRVVVHKGTMGEFRGVVVSIDAKRVSVLRDGDGLPRRYAPGSVRPVDDGVAREVDK